MDIGGIKVVRLTAPDPLLQVADGQSICGVGRTHGEVCAFPASSFTVGLLRLRIVAYHLGASEFFFDPADQGL